MNLNYEQDIYIDDSALDVEWLEQPSLMFRYAQNATNTRLILDTAKQNLEVIRSLLDKYIREDPTAYEVSKITDTVVANTVILQPEYQEAFKKWLTAKNTNEVAQNAVKAVDARKDTLENMVKLHGQNYFAGPKMPRDLKEQRESFNKKVSSGIANKLNSRRTT